jgi:hypothetical protein
MPKIRDYGSAEMNAQAPAYSSSSELQYSADMGRSISNAANTIDNVGDMLYRRQEQEETSDINAGFAELTSASFEEVDQGIQDGSIDVGKYQESLQGRIDKLSENISTRAGRNAFDRNAYQLKAQATKRATLGAAAVAGAKAKSDAATVVNQYSSSLWNDPSEFQNNFNSTMNAVDDLVATGGLRAVDAEKLKVGAAAELAKGAVRGWARLDPELAEKKLASGEYDRFLDGDKKAEMQNYINQQRRAKDVQANLNESNARRAEKLQQEAWMEKNISNLVDGKLSTQQILSSPLKPEKKMSLINAMQREVAAGGSSDPRARNEILRRIQLPDGAPGKIVDSTQIINAVGNGISMKDAKELKTFLASTPGNEAMVDGEKALFDLAKKMIGSKNQMGFYDSSADEQYNISRFMTDYAREKAKAIAEKKDPRTLVDPNSKEYFGFKARNYKLDAKSTLKIKAEEAAKTAQALKTAIGTGSKLVPVIRLADGKAGDMTEEQWQKADKSKYRLGK